MTDKPMKLDEIKNPDLTRNTCETLKKLPNLQKFSSLKIH